MKTIRDMCKWLVANNLDDCPLHFSRFSPLYRLTQLPATPLFILQKAHDIAVNTGMKYDYVGNLPGSNLEDTACPKCRKTVVERKGFRIIQNNIAGGNCTFCGERIAGVWS